MVHLAGLNENGIAPEGANAGLVRDSYLVGQLIESAIHPVPRVRLSAELVTEPVNFGKIQLNCTGPKPSPIDAMNAQAATVCVSAEHHGRSSDARARRRADIDQTQDWEVS